MKKSEDQQMVEDDLDCQASDEVSSIDTKLHALATELKAKGS